MPHIETERNTLPEHSFAGSNALPTASQKTTLGDYDELEQRRRQGLQRMKQVQAVEGDEEKNGMGGKSQSGLTSSTRRKGLSTPNSGNGGAG